MRNYWKTALLISLVSGFVYAVLLAFRVTLGGDMSLNSSLTIAWFAGIIAILASIVLYKADEKKYSQRNHEPPSFSLALVATGLAFALRVLWSCGFRPDDFWSNIDFLSAFIAAGVSLISGVIFAIYLLRQAIKQEEASETEPGIIRKNGQIIYTYKDGAIVIIFLFFLAIQTVIIWWIPDLFLLL